MEQELERIRQRLEQILEAHCGKELCYQCLVILCQLSAAEEGIALQRLLSSKDLEPKGVQIIVNGQCEHDGRLGETYKKVSAPRP